MEIENLFFTEPKSIVNGYLSLEGQEAQHAAKVMRFRKGDTMYASDGLGNLYECDINEITKTKITAQIRKKVHIEEPAVKKVIAFGAIKKRDRIEFAVEKAVELGAWEICIFHADHSERSRINRDRLKAIAKSAFKQSKRAWLPKVVFIDSLDEVMDHYEGHHIILAYMQAEAEKPAELTEPKNLMLIGPEGGFSEREVNIAKDRNAKLITLGNYRLRAETAVLSLLSLYIFQ